MPERSSFDYAVIRVAPSVEREEFINAGIILYCRTQGFLHAKIIRNFEKLKAFAPEISLQNIRKQLESIPKICTGGKEAGDLGKLSQSERFNHLVAPKSAMIQSSPVHCGLCDDPQAQLEKLYSALVE